MKKRGLAAFSSVIVLGLFFLFSGEFSSLWGLVQPPVKEHQLTIKKVRNKWKVIVGQDTLRTRITAKRGEKITWVAEGTDAYFQFMGNKLFGNYTRTLKDGKKLTLVVGNNARKGIHYYAVFCTADMEYAEGESPPQIGVE